MKEIPLLFKGPMVRATLDDTKTQTRRGITRLLGFGPITEFGVSDTYDYDYIFRDRKMRWNDLRFDRVLEACPYGQPGDRLWVRETWAKPGESFAYRANYSSDAMLGWRWKPSIHMPRIASRINLVNKGVRIEHLQDISEADALAEGIFELDDGYFSWPGHEEGYNTAREAYFALSASINGEAHVAKNPLVWVIDFERVKK